MQFLLDNARFTLISGGNALTIGILEKLHSSNLIIDFFSPQAAPEEMQLKSPVNRLWLNVHTLMLGLKLPMRDGDQENRN